ncbi:cytochrome P450 [Mycobacterium paragordonae]|uniref:cytochrome P450 n=1 Tax=Mycobacterium paragordonae TaxID=1389713 RepID=UPI00105E096F|nr:cytochrome P450 [Mycobacterium paragordonae]TDK95517.1 cytochrome P450 [Mycobacterium paragordonae]TDL07811.1 cytochrome P450 [Mycobacterium paragordonae]
MKDRLHWFAMHGVVRGVAKLAVRRGDLQARLIADPAVADDPVPFYDEIRRRGGLVRNRANLMTVDHRLAHDILRSDDFHVINFGDSLPKPLRWLESRTRDDRLHPMRPPSLLAVEPPDHTRYRKTVSAVFTSRAVTALRDRVQQTADELLDRLVDRPGGVDIVGRYCSQLPITVISDILGVPEYDRRRVLEFGELAAPSLDIGLPWQQYVRVQRGVAGFNAWLVQHLRELQRNPGDDLMSQLIQTAQSGSADSYLDDIELQAVAGLVLVAGFETTVNLLGNGIRMLLDHPDQLEKLRDRPELWPNAVEEILRLDSPVQLTARVAGSDVEVAGMPIYRDEVVVVYLAAANRDPTVFADPHRFDVERSNAGRHLAFSTGRHFCLGAALARAEGEVGLRTFFDRFPDVQIAGSGSRRSTRVLRGWSTLPVQLGQTRSVVAR